MSDPSQELLGIEKAPEFFFDGFSDIQFFGVNTLFIPYRNVIRPEGLARVVPFLGRVPTGALASIERQLYRFVKEHRLLTDHDVTR